LKDAYVSTGDDTTVHPSAPQQTKVVKAVKSKPSAYPKVQPMKAALYFENANGFGEWRIIVGTDATKKLQELANGDKKKCVIVVKKIKYVACLPPFGALTIVTGNFRTGIFLMKIRKG
jgi:hypothetical protein